MNYLIYISLMVLSIGLLTSPTILALFHILIVIPIIILIPKVNLKKLSISSWALLACSIFIILSVLVNQDIAVNSYKPIYKSKYFIIGLLSIIPFSFYFKNYWDEKKLRKLLYLFCIATTFATVVGMFSQYNQFNPITFKVVDFQRNAGLFGMVMNYAHNLSYFLILITGLIIYRSESENFIGIKFLYITFAINLFGLYLTYTRGAWLAYFAGLPFFLLKKNKKLFCFVIVSLVIVGSLTLKLAGNSVVRPKSDAERLSQWKAAVMAFKERPILGYGYLNFEQHSVEIKKRYNIGEVQFGGHAHSNLFEMLGSVGILGLLSFLFWVISWFIEMYKRNDLMGKLGLPFIVVFFVGGLTQSTISLGINLFFIMAVYSLTQVRKDLFK